MCAPKMKWKFP